MDRTTLMRDFISLTESEVYYKRVFDARDTGYKNNRYLDSFDFFEVVNRNSQFIASAPEYAFVLPEEITESHHQFKQSDVSVNLFRHQRYTPVFRHKHTFFEFVIVIKGECIHVMNDNETTLKAGEMCMIPPGVHHGIWVEKDSIVINMHILKRFFGEVWSSFSFQKNPLSNFFSASLISPNESRFLSFNTNNDEDIANLILDMYIEHHYEVRYKAQVIDSMAIILFSRLLRKYEDTIVQNSSSKYDNSSSAEFIEYIEHHLSGINLEDMAKHFNYSPQYLSKKIKKITGHTFVEIVRHIRFEQAKKLLSNSTASIAEIGRTLGYINAENFTRSFKQMSGMNPKNYRTKKSGVLNK